MIQVPEADAFVSAEGITRRAKSQGLGPGPPHAGSGGVQDGARAQGMPRNLGRSRRLRREPGTLARGSKRALAG